MKKILFFLLILCSADTFAEVLKQSPNSDITGVKIFLSGAQVVRTAKTTVEKGETEVSFEGLSSMIDQQSIIVNGSGDAMIKGVNFTIDYLRDKKKTPELIKLQDSLLVLQGVLDKLNMNESVFHEELGLLNENKKIGGENTGVTAENLKKVADFYRQRTIEIKTRLIEINNDKTKVNEKIAKVNNQINEWNGKLNQPSGTIIVTLAATQRAAVSLNISYYVAAASWTPFYELHGKGVKDNIDLIYKAAVRQQSGENWDNIKLTLSTGNPQLSNSKPNMYPWFIDFFVQSTYKYKQSMERGAAAPAPAMLESVVISADAISHQELKAIDVDVTENTISNEFEIKESYSVQSSGKDVTVSIDQHDLPASFEYYTAPRLDKTAYLLASITGWEQLSLLPGEANIYFENSYVGKSYINPGSTEDTLRLSMGRDPRIVVKREKVQDLSSVKLIGSNTTKKFTYDITVRNTRSESIKIRLDDQIPVTKNEAIKVTSEELSGGSLNEETGIINWNVDLKPGEMKKFRISYTVKYPKDKIINGL